MLSLLILTFLEILGSTNGSQEPGFYDVSEVGDGGEGKG